MVREHTEQIKPPRALWVPFPLGRPFGAPRAPEFQLEVLRALLGLFAYETGPVLVDFGKDAPADESDDEEWSCPLPLPSLPEAKTEAERLIQALQSEVSFLMPWYEESMRRRAGRTMVGITGLTAQSAPDLAAFLAAVAAGEWPEPPAGVKEPMPLALRPIMEDMKTFYLEAAQAQPGRAAPRGHQLNRWLYYETRFGDVLYSIRDRLDERKAANPDFQTVPVIHWLFSKRPERSRSAR